MFFSAVLQAAVKKGPNARGGLVWKTHAFWKPSPTRRKNAKKKQAALNAVDAALREAEALPDTPPKESAVCKLYRARPDPGPGPGADSAA